LVSANTYEIVVLQGGKQHDIYNRVKSRIPVPISQLKDFSVYKVGQGYIFSTSDKENDYVYQRYISIDSRFRTIVSENAEAGEYTA